MTTATVNRLRRTANANPTAFRMNPVIRFKTCISSPPSLLAPRGIRSAGNLVLPRRVRSPARRMPSNGIAWKMRRPRRGSHRRTRGEKDAVRPGVKGKRQGTATGKCDRPRADRRTKSGGMDESCQSLPRTRYRGRNDRPGELRQEASDRTANVIAEPARVERERGEFSPPRGEPASQPAEAVSQACRAGRSVQRTPTPAYVNGRGDVCTPSKQSRPSKRHLRGSKARPFSTASRCGKRLSLRGDHRESAMLNPSGQNPWAAVRRAQCSILCSRSRIRGMGTLQVSRHETTGKA